MNLIVDFRFGFLYLIKLIKLINNIMKTLNTNINYLIKLSGSDPIQSNGRPKGLIKTLKNTKLTKMQLDFNDI